MIIYPVSGPTTEWTVVCLCAKWCRTCEGYEAAFAQHAVRSGEARHIWIDVEDDEDLIGDIDIETFPTLLVLQGTRPMFFGPVLPHIDVVDRTLRATRQHGPSGNPVSEEHREAVERLVAAVHEDLVRTTPAR